MGILNGQTKFFLENLLSLLKIFLQRIYFYVLFVDFSLILAVFAVNLSQKNILQFLLLNASFCCIILEYKFLILEGFIMAYIINDNCISCGVCEAECPTNCISAGDSKYVVTEADCIDCGACAGVCPVEACQQA